MAGFRNSVSGLHNLTVYELRGGIVESLCQFLEMFPFLEDRDWRLGLDRHCTPQHVVLWPIGELPERAVGSDRRLVADFTVLWTAKTMHALFSLSRRKWGAL
jgi:hypothetical protein